MSPKEAHIYMKWCNDNYIFIYPVPFYNTEYKIAVMRLGKEKIGEKRYPQFPKANEENWSNAIRDLYKEYYELNYKPKELTTT